MRIGSAARQCAVCRADGTPTTAITPLSSPRKQGGEDSSSTLWGKLEGGKQKSLGRK
jgi:hypothetical protein